MSNMYLIHVVCLILSYHVLCNAINIREGYAVKLDFQYPCDSTEVTLQRSNGHPFYRSANPEHNTLMTSRYEVAEHTDRITDECFLNLTINPVSRDDEGTFILITYKDGQILPDLTRISLRVDYPPGKASCESYNEHIDGEWVSLRCTAPVGTLRGQILCYQDDMRLPSLTSPEVSGKTLSQVMLSRLAGFVYCCTSTYQQTRDRCECNDFRWNPNRNTELSNISDPCTATTETTEQDLTTALIQQDQQNSAIHPNSLDPQTGKNTCDSNNWIYTFITTTCLSALGYIALIYFLYKARKKKNQLKKQSDANEDEPHEQHELSKTV